MFSSKLVISAKLSRLKCKVHHACRLMHSIPVAPAFKRLDSAYIDGEWVQSSSGKTFDVSCPATGQHLATVPDMGRNEIDKAVLAAHKAFYLWRERSAKERSDILKVWHKLIVQHADQLTELCVAENGKVRQDARGEINYGASFVEWFAEEGRRVYGDIVPSSLPGRKIMLVKQPIGVVGCITPFNFPNAMITRKVAPALAAGCTIVLRPSEETPLSAIALTELAEKAGFPAGVFNVVTSGYENGPVVGEALCRNDLVSKISFTGSTSVGKVLLKQSADTVKKMSLELGGNAPFIVFNSADVSAAVEGAMASKFRCSGQTCVCANRMLVQEGVFDEFVAEVTRATEKLTIGNGFEDGIHQGPLINNRAVHKMKSMVDDALDKGAVATTGGSQPELGGNYFNPTILTNITDNMRVAREEIFGPVAPIIKFKTEEEALAIANSTNVGLAGYFYSKDISQIWRVAERLETGIVGVNAALFSTTEASFGGVKQSGLGREGSKYGIDDFLEIKYVCLGVDT